MLIQFEVWWHTLSAHWPYWRSKSQPHIKHSCRMYGNSGSEDEPLLRLARVRPRSMLISLIILQHKGAVLSSENYEFVIMRTRLKAMHNFEGQSLNHPNVMTYTVF